MLVGLGVGGAVGWVVIFGLGCWSSLGSSFFLIIEVISGWDFGVFSFNWVRFGGGFCAVVGLG